MQKSFQVEFFDKSLNSLSAKLQEAGKARFTQLDGFNRDCKSLQQMLQKFGTPDIEFVFIETNADDQHQYALGYVDETLVWRDNFAHAGGGDPIQEAPAAVRASIMNDGLLKLLMEDAILALQDIQDLEEIK